MAYETTRRRRIDLMLGFLKMNGGEMAIDDLKSWVMFEFGLSQVKAGEYVEVCYRAGKLDVQNGRVKLKE